MLQPVLRTLTCHGCVPTTVDEEGTCYSSVEDAGEDSAHEQLLCNPKLGRRAQSTEASHLYVACKWQRYAAKAYVSYCSCLDICQANHRCQAIKSAWIRDFLPRRTDRIRLGHVSSESQFEQSSGQRVSATMTLLLFPA